MILDNDKMNGLQLPFEFFNIPGDDVPAIKDGDVLSITDMVGMILCTSGSVEMKNGFGLYHLKAKDIFLYSPSGLMQIKSISNDFQGTFIKVQMNYVISVIYNLLDIRTQMYLRENPQLSLDDKQYDFVLNYLLDLDNRIKDENQQGIDDRRRIVFTELIKSQLRTLFYETINIYMLHLPVDMKAPNRDDEIVQHFIISLDMHFRAERNVAFYADEQCLSYSYFSGIVKSKTGMSALQWIINRVIVDAKQELEFTNDSIKQIADKLNFPTQSFFGKYFKQYVGMSPKEYRKRAISRKGDMPDKQIEINVM